MTEQQTSPKAKKPRPAWGRLFRRVAGVGIVAAVVWLIVVAWLPKPVVVETAMVTRGPLVVTVDEDGRTRVKDRYVVSAPLAGNLARIELRPGDQVERGQALAYLVPLSAPLLDERSRARAEAQVAAAQAAIRQATAQIERATAAAEYAESEAERQRKLVQSNVAPEQSLDHARLEQKARKAELTSARFGARVANYELEMARAALGRVKDKTQGNEQFVVPSPIDGRVLKVIHESEGVAQPGTALLEVGDPQALEIVVDVLTSDAVNIRSGANVMVEEWGGKPLSGAVRLVEPSAFTRISALGVEEQRVNAVIDLNEPYETWSALGDGYRVEAKVEVFRAPEAVKVPESALFRHEQKWASYLVRDGTAVLHGVEVGRRNGREAEVLGGLEPGQRVVLHPSDRVTDGVELSLR